MSDFNEYVDDDDRLLNWESEELEPEFDVEDERYWDTLLKYGDLLGPPCFCTMETVCNNCLTEVTE